MKFSSPRSTRLFITSFLFIVNSQLFLIEETNYEIRFKSADSIIYADDSRQSLVQVTIFGDNGSSGSIDIASGETEPKKFDPRSITIKKKAFDAGKVTIIFIDESWFISFFLFENFS